jgi:hypothetical protein
MVILFFLIPLALVWAGALIMRHIEWGGRKAPPPGGDL